MGAGYIVRIEVLADPQIPPLTSADIAMADVNATLSEVLEQIEHMSVDELQDGVYRRFEFRLCGGCQRAYLANPMRFPRRVLEGKN
jgi:hypothetical protein